MVCGWPVEGQMKTGWKQVVLATIFISAVASAGAQAAASSPPAPDSAVLAKANAGDAAAQVQMGDASRTAGDALAQTPKLASVPYKMAAEWYRKAAEQGLVTGQMRLAELYRDGKGVARDMAQAAEWYHKAAEQGDVAAQGILGVLYSFGQGVAQNYVEAYYWLDLAASVKGPNQEKYAANRQLVGQRITADELADVHEREEKWLAAHPRAGATQ
jgi:hypothetical protein